MLGGVVGIGTGLVLILLFGHLLVPGQQAQTQAQQTQAPPVLGETATVIRVVDGDTLETETHVKLRVIGGDTPETTKGKNQCYGRESDARTAELTLGKTVTLTRDPTQQDEDRYHRKLRMVTLPDGSDLMEHLIREGYAQEKTYDGPYQRQQTYRLAEAAAKLELKGRWAVCGK